MEPISSSASIKRIYATTNQPTSPRKRIFNTAHTLVPVPYASKSAKDHLPRKGNLPIRPVSSTVTPAETTAVPAAVSATSAAAGVVRDIGAFCGDLGREVGR